MMKLLDFLLTFAPATERIFSIRVPIWLISLLILLIVDIVRFTYKGTNNQRISQLLSAKCP